MLQVMEIRDAIREDRCCQVYTRHVWTALDLSGTATCDRLIAAAGSDPPNPCSRNYQHYCGHTVILDRYTSRLCSSVSKAMGGKLSAILQVEEQQVVFCAAAIEMQTSDS